MPQFGANVSIGEWFRLVFLSYVHTIAITAIYSRFSPREHEPSTRRGQTARPQTQIVSEINIVEPKKNRKSHRVLLVGYVASAIEINCICVFSTINPTIFFDFDACHQSHIRWLRKTKTKSAISEWMMLARIQCILTFLCVFVSSLKCVRWDFLFLWFGAQR